MNQFPDKQTAVQLVGPDKLTMTEDKAVFSPGPEQILCKVETVGLCFSDLKLLKQFSDHARKGPVVSGIDAAILDEIPSYVPGDKPTVPGHETVVKVIEVGENVKDIKPGKRYLVQTDWRWIKTENSNGAFGYNFEGALQEYNLLDQRIFVSPEGKSMLIEVTGDDELSCSSIALCEPWACVEDAYVVHERRKINADSRMLVVSEISQDKAVFNAFLESCGKPAKITCLGACDFAHDSGVEFECIDSIDKAQDQAFDDVIYYGANADLLEKLFAKVTANGLINIVLGAKKLGRKIQTPVGRVHYGPIRIIGTESADPAEAMKVIPATGEIRKGDNINVVGAGGPMGVMHVIRDLCQGVEDVTVFAGDLDDDRLAMLMRVAKPVAKDRNLGFLTYNSKKEAPDVKFGYSVLMAPVPMLVQQAIEQAAPGGIINIFAGIPADKYGELDLDMHISKKLYMIGTSGSTLEDMLAVLRKVEAQTLNTDLSVAAVTGLSGAVEGIRAVEARAIPGKILVYPACKTLGLTPLDKLQELYPQVAAKLNEGFWCKAAEETLLETVK